MRQRTRKVVKRTYYLPPDRAGALRELAAENPSEDIPAAMLTWMALENAVREEVRRRTTDVPVVEAVERARAILGEWFRGHWRDAVLRSNRFTPIFAAGPIDRPKGPKTLRTYYLPESLADGFRDFSAPEGPSYGLSYAIVTWLALSGDAREAIRSETRRVGVKDALPAIRHIIQDAILDQCRLTYMRSLPPKKQLRLFSQIQSLNRKVIR